MLFYSFWVKRQLVPFYRFLDLCAQYNAEILNYANIARESHTSEKTIKSYFQILEDTLLGFFLPAYDVSVKRSLSKHPKFYFFDNAITNCLKQRLNDPLSPQELGPLFEQFIINQVRAYFSYEKKQRHLSFWRTSTGDEVDLLITQGTAIKIAIEIKYMKRIEKSSIKSLYKFKAEHPNIKCIVVSLVELPYKLDDILILNWKSFLEVELGNV